MIAMAFEMKSIASKDTVDRQKRIKAIKNTPCLSFRFAQLYHHRVDLHKYQLFKKAGGCLAISLYVFLHTARFHFELLEHILVDLF